MTMCERRKKRLMRIKALKKFCRNGMSSYDKMAARIRKTREENKGYVDEMSDYEEEYLNLRKYGNEFGVASKFSKKLCKLIKKAVSIKEQLLINNKQDSVSESLLVSVEDLVTRVTRYYKYTRDVPYNWMGRRFIPSLQRGTKIIYPKLEKIWLQERDLLDFKFAEESDDDNEAECENPQTHPTCFTPCLLYCSPSIAMLQLGIATSRLSRYIRSVYYPNEIEEKIWQEFKEFVKETPEAKVMGYMYVEEEPMSIKVDHPIVGAIATFALNAFNEVCEMHVKKGEHNNLHDPEVMECKYFKFSMGYYFYVAIEAIEEGIFGIYEAQVICNGFDRKMTLCKFVLTDHTPFGTKAMAVKYSACLKSIRKTVDDLYYEKRTRLKELSRWLLGEEQGRAQHEKYRLKERHIEIRKALQQRLKQDSRLPDWNRTTNPDSWSHPDEGDSGMIRRATSKTCSGYDFYNLYD